MTTLYLVACVAAKRECAAPAQDMYISPWFQKARRYVEGQRDAHWRILSARYGLLDPATTIDPYDETLNRMSAAARRRWADSVLHDLLALVAEGDSVVVLAGETYRAGLTGPLESHGVFVEVPMKGLTIGRQLQWLDGASAHG